MTDHVKKNGRGARKSYCPVCKRVIKKYDPELPKTAKCPGGPQ